MGKTAGAPARSPRTKYGWVVSGVLVPFVTTRLLLLLIAWFSQYFEAGNHYHNPHAATRGWEWSTCRMLDVWGRWDTGWYFSIIDTGYELRGDPEAIQSNFAFFPLYPCTVKIASQLVPGDRTHEKLLVVGVILSNLFLIGSLLLLHVLVREVLKDRDAAERTNWYILLGPAGFFFSAFYTESIYLFFSLAAFLAAVRHRWALACFLGAVLSASRPLGVLIGWPILLLYMRSRGWKLSNVGLSILWLGIVPAGLVLYLWHAYTISGDFFAPIHVQSSWNRGFQVPWDTILNLKYAQHFITQIDRVICVVFLALSTAALFMLPSVSYGVLALLTILPPLTSGSLDSITRYCAVIFPAFMVLAIAGGKHRTIDCSLRMVLVALQVFYFTGWCQFYAIY